MKQKVPVHVYCNQEYLGKAESITEAANKANVTQSTIYAILKAKVKRKTTKNGYYFSYDQLSEEEMLQLPIKATYNKENEDVGYTKHVGKGCKQIVNKQEYEVNCNNPMVTYQARNKKERIQHFKTFLFNRFRERWLVIPKSAATLEQIYIKEFLNSL